MRVTPDQLRAIVPALSAERAAWVAAGLNEAAAWVGVTTPQRMAAFIAQWAHESAGFKYLKELWGPTDAQRRYEGRADLGNCQPGDGRRYCGRGWAQLTGRANYRKYGQVLGLPLETQPELVERPDVAWRVAAAYWRDHGLNALADAGNFREITRRINGGYNGLADRQAYHARAKQVLAQVGPGRVLLVPMGGGEPTPWDGKPTKYAGTLLDDALVAVLRQMYPVPGGPWQYSPGLTVYLRRNGDFVLERATNIPS